MSYPYKTQFFLKHPKYEPPLNDQDAQIDPKNKLEPKCLEKCSKYVKLYDSCAERVIAHPEQHLQCLGQHYDIRYCVDNCVAKDLFRFLK
ncbi:ubiquinol-cytochrome c reductase subunit 6 [Babesia microti strain RI]|uniref:Cytochrome b-c1 complex subunit 6 n=1 Tax=Babesia microti (strain RI) TaxID=1133968 RepID=A0A1N6LWW8_BABMR|nr:ubiquinol-cytochrome c reductase subunit 6 [Babesia microti strain RI]SIO73363.1 ubiquinol-cytochrome c reductase subunit 6 [Babesia microti strain RI]|eukprot:XP_021337464.1 ubiquinol-cytochrome c reductase subunit 6 [Babesia microti strain RI]